MSNQIGNVFIHYLPSDFTKEDLETLCSKFGVIRSAKVMINLKTGTSKGYGFVRFGSCESALRCINGINGIVVGKKRLLARLATSIENVGIPTNSIYVKSLPLTYEKRDVWELFQKYGNILGVEIVMNDKTKLPKGSAYVTFSSQEESMRAVEKMNNVVLEADGWPLFIRYTDKQIIENEPSKYGIRIEKPKKMKEISSYAQNARSTALKEIPIKPQYHKPPNCLFKGHSQPNNDNNDSNDMYLQLLEDIDKEEEED